MKSMIAEAIKLNSEPVALLWTDDLPDGALQFEKGKWGCAMSLIAVAAKGRTVALDRETFGCIGGGVGLGFGNQYEDFPGGLDGFSHFLSNGNAQTPQGPAIAAGMAADGARQDFCDHFLHGERYRRDAALARQYVDQLPIRDIPTRYVVFKSLAELADEEQPISVTFFVNPDQLSACVVMANYDRADVDSVGIPHVAACQVIGLLSYAEAATGWPRCLVGLTDLSARQNLKTALGSDKMSFTMPFQRFLQMEASVPGSFLESATWRSLID